MTRLCLALSFGLLLPSLAGCATAPPVLVERARSSAPASFVATADNPLFTYTVRFAALGEPEMDTSTSTPLLKRVILDWSPWPTPVFVQRRDELSDWTTLDAFTETTSISYGLCVDDREDQWRAAP